MQQKLVQLDGGAKALALQILGNADDAADAVQDAMTTVLARPDAYDESKGALKPWFLRIVRNRCIDLRRRQRPSGEDVSALADAAPGPEQAVEASARASRVHDALASLSEDAREIIVLRDFLDLSYAEIADVLGIANGTVMSRLHRARLALKDTLETYED